MNVDKVQARKMVLVSAFLLAIIAVYKDRKTAGPADTFRVLWGVGVVALMLSLLADFAPKIAGPFAALAVLGSLVSSNGKILETLLGGTGAVINAGANVGTKAPSSNTKTVPNASGGTTTTTGP